MLLEALLAHPYLDLQLKTATRDTHLRRRVTAVAPTELIEPTAYLQGSELITLAGIAMNFQDARTWDAYVERLSKVPVAGIVFNSGIAHSAVPTGLISAGNKFDVPVLEVAPPVNLLQVHRLVTDTLQAETYALLRRSLTLADQCAELEARGTTVLELLDRIRTAVGGEVGLIDEQGRLVASQPVGMQWTVPPTSRARSEGNQMNEHVRHLNSVRDGSHFSIAVRSPEDEATLDALLGPVGAIVSLHLSSTAEQYSEENERMRTLVEHLRSPHTESPRHTQRLMRAAGFNPSRPVLLATIKTGPDRNDSWRLRFELSALLPSLGLADVGDHLVLLGQGFTPATATAAMLRLLIEIAPRRPAIVSDPIHDIGSLRTAMLASPRQLMTVSEPTLARKFDLASVLATGLSSSAVNEALRFLAPLRQYDKDNGTDLMRTMRAYLECDGSPGKTATKLFIHRNSLTHRLTRIAHLLGVSLSTVDGQTTCAVALAVWDMQRHR
ncbi:MAG: helix-turn-helix domain-containing protein [Mycobacterium sp.]